MAHWHGGDWKGVEDRLDYIQALGVTTLWISPVVKNVDSDAGFDGYHGYWTQDLDSPNPHFGDVPALRRMVAAAHGLGMKVILDIVTNHMGQLFYYDINKNGQPDNNVYGYGCDKFIDPNDPNNPYTQPNATDPSCLVSSLPSLLKSAAWQSCRSRMELKKFTSAALNVPLPLLIHRLAGCQWCEANISGEPSPLKSAMAALKDQSGGRLIPAAAAWSVIFTPIGLTGGGVFGGGLGAGPVPGAAGPEEPGPRRRRGAIPVPWGSSPAR